ncbi:hypothetical protein QYF36_013475 [Acer negundo]|nr:hypothetical protein QYF36_013475 [Acer negundo]
MFVADRPTGDFAEFVKKTSHRKTLDASLKAHKENLIDLKDRDASVTRKRHARGKAKIGEKTTIERQAMSMHSLIGSSNLESSYSYYKDGEYEGKPSDEVPYRGMTIHRHLGIDKELEGLRDVIVKDMKRLKEEVTKMKARTGAR